MHDSRYMLVEPSLILRDSEQDNNDLVDMGFRRNGNIARHVFIFALDDVRVSCTWPCLIG